MHPPSGPWAPQGTGCLAPMPAAKGLNDFLSHILPAHVCNRRREQSLLRGGLPLLEVKETCLLLPGTTRMEAGGRCVRAFKGAIVSWKKSWAW